MSVKCSTFSKDKELTGGRRVPDGRALEKVRQDKSGIEGEKNLGGRALVEISVDET